MTPSPCKSCGAPVLWAKMPSGKIMPLDLEPCPEGNVRLYPGGKAVVLRAAEVAMAAPPLYRSHFATCPDGAKHKNP
jgi:hypothetical protein